MNTATSRRFRMYKYFQYHSRLYHYKDLAKLFNVSESTIKRDLKFMVMDGWISKKSFRGKVDSERYGGFYITAK